MRSGRSSWTRVAELGRRLGAPAAANASSNTP